jgi:hypothetical protein
VSNVPEDLECGGRTKWRRRFGSLERRPHPTSRTDRRSQSGVAARRLALPPHSKVRRLSREQITRVGPGLGLSEGAVKVAVHRLRKRYGEVLRVEIAGTVSNPREVDGEIRHLITVLNRCLRTRNPS